MEIRNNEFLILSVPYSPEDVEYERGDCDCGGEERVMFSNMSKYLYNIMKGRRAVK